MESFSGKHNFLGHFLVNLKSESRCIPDLNTHVGLPFSLFGRLVMSKIISEPKRNRFYENGERKIELAISDKSHTNRFKPPSGADTHQRGFLKIFSLKIHVKSPLSHSSYKNQRYQRQALKCSL